MNKKLIKDFIKRNKWKEAKSYKKTAPHEYLVLDDLSKKDKIDFIDFIIYIRKNGIKERFWRTFFIYYYLDGYKYWTMGNPIEETTILNRVKV